MAVGTADSAVLLQNPSNREESRRVPGGLGEVGGGAPRLQVAAALKLVLLPEEEHLVAPLMCPHGPEGCFTGGLHHPAGFS